jgi:hypothetical protein
MPVAALLLYHGSVRCLKIRVELCQVRKKCPESGRVGCYHTPRQQDRRKEWRPAGHCASLIGLSSQLLRIYHSIPAMPSFPPRLINPINQLLPTILPLPHRLQSLVNNGSQPTFLHPLRMLDKFALRPKLLRRPRKPDGMLEEIRFCRIILALESIRLTTRRVAQEERGLHVLPWTERAEETHVPCGLAGGDRRGDGLGGDGGGGFGGYAVEDKGEGVGGGAANLGADVGVALELDVSKSAKLGPLEGLRIGLT